jgi:peptidoglycan/xylan/chitin deacetylase (PgdA/CDA1 family)
MAVNNGSFVISLDFELMWGVRDVVTKQSYGEHIRGVHQAMPSLLNYFNNYSVKATFATVGVLFFKNKTELLANLPSTIPAYDNSNLSPYGKYIENEVIESYPEDPYHYGWHLLKLVQLAGVHEIGTHTFSHYYCLEKGQSLEAFEADINKAVYVAQQNDIAITSIVFPRNQVNDDYLQVCKNAGIQVYRGTENSWIYSARSFKNESIVRRMVRLLDAYINLSGHHCYTMASLIQPNGMVNIPSSRFLRPYTPLLKKWEALRLRRITRAMTHAAKNGLVYHLWWHPHNFGINQQENLSFLQKILEHYQLLRQKYAFNSLTMSELSATLLKNNEK